VTRVTVVDLGTNSTRLLVADVADGRVTEVARRLTITRLGEGVDAGRTLLPAAIERVERCLAEYRATADALGATRAVAVATSAVRDARNGREFLAAVEQRYGFPTRLLSGDEEALLTFAGVTAGRRVREPTVVVDLGGGSTELIVGDDGGVSYRASLELGCVRLTERFLAHDPARADELAALRASVRAALEAAVPPNVRPRRAIGVAGTVTTLATLDLGLAEEEPDLLHGHVLATAWIESQARVLAATPLAQLRKRRGLHPGRAPVIAAGALAVAEILRLFGLEELEVSEADILHGAALELAE
jgi:exopolyphosphatase/guanosine-5'-triphosphate,3'-diphosphate pyrophosphatase